MSRFLASSLGKTFLGCLFLASMLLVVTGYTRWHAMLDAVDVEVESVKRLLARSAEDRFFQQEVMLRLLGERLIEVGAQQDVDAAAGVVDALLRDNPVFIAYGVVHPGGSVIARSASPGGDASADLLEVVRDNAGLASSRDAAGLSLGRKRFVASMGRWVIPLRYPVRDTAGRTALTIVAPIALDGPYNPWRLDDVDVDLDVHVMLQVGPGSRYVSLYQAPLAGIDGSRPGMTREDGEATPSVDDLVRGIGVAADMTLADLKAPTGTVGFVSNGPGLASAYVAVSYGRRYRLMTAVSRPLTGPVSDFLWSLMLIGAVYLACIAGAFVILYRMWRMDDRNRAALTFAATHDQLTRLPNRYHLLSQYPVRFLGAASPYALLYVDLDDFKFINDHYGHSVGDRVLVEIAARLAAACDDSAMLVRQGGDEFIILMFFDGQQGLRRFAEHLLLRIRETIDVDGLQASLSASIGIACQETRDESLDHLLMRGDLAMYEAKRSRNNIAFFAPRLLADSEARAVIEGELRQAVIDDEMSVVYQPQIAAMTGAVIGVEALVRWHSARLGEVEPERFVAAAEANGRIRAIGDFVIDTALRDVASLRPRFGEIRVSINVSVQQLLQAGFREALKQRARRHAMPANRITIEVTESLFIEDNRQVGNLLLLLRADGFGISLDDFGTGYSSLSVLRTMPVTEVKIDKSFVRDILSDSDDRALIRGIIGIGDSLTLPVLAEGVEAMEQVSQLKAYGCACFQGNYFAPPMALADLETYLGGLDRYAI